MSAVTVRAAGVAALRRRLAALPDAARTAAAPGFTALAEEAAGDVRVSLGAGPGPSAPGAAPGDPSGRLAATVSAAPTEAGSAVTAAAPEAALLEYGTLRMAARPFLRPVASRAGRAGLALLGAALRRGLRP